MSCDVARKATRAATVAAWLCVASLASAHASIVVSSGRLDLNTAGGFAGGRHLGSESSALLQWGASLDTSQAGWWRGGRFDVSVEGVRAGGSPSAGTQVLQWPDNEWAPNFLRVYQATYEQRWQRALLRAGIMDINQYFEASDVADLLHNASFGLAPTFTANFNDPSFPNPGLGAMVQWRADSAWRARAGVWQGDPPGLGGALHRGDLSVFEVERDWGSTGADAPATDLKLGAWRYSQPDAALGANTAGAYVVGETRWREAGRQWGAFVLAGNAPADRNLVRDFLGAGVLVGGPFAGRPDDSFSAGVTQVRISGLHAETVLEAVYSWQLASDLALQPDVQRVWAPGGLGAPAWIAGARLHLTF